MKSKIFTNKAFTLIELLVVVLIIGILTAIAVPKYKMAMLKSKVSSHLSLMKSLASAQEVYYLKNGKYAKSFEDLDLSLPKSCIFYHSDKSTFYCDKDVYIDNYSPCTAGGCNPVGRLMMKFCPGVADKGDSYCTSATKGGLANISFYLSKHDTYPNEIHCMGRNDTGNKLCQQFSDQMVID